MVGNRWENEMECYDCPERWPDCHLWAHQVARTTRTALKYWQALERHALTHPPVKSESGMLIGRGFCFSAEIVIRHCERASVLVCVCVCERERERVCVCERERDSKWRYLRKVIWLCLRETDVQELLAHHCWQMRKIRNSTLHRKYEFWSSGKLDANAYISTAIFKQFCFLFALSTQTRSPTGQNRLAVLHCLEYVCSRRRRKGKRRI